MIPKLPRPMKGEHIPLNAVEETLDKMIKRFGYVYASIKYDGYRCRAFNGRAYTSSPKLFRNRHMQRCFAEAQLPDGLDGEAFVDPMNFQSTQSGLTKREGEPAFTFAVFDLVAGLKFSSREKMLFEMFQQQTPHWLHRVAQMEFSSVQGILDCEKSVIELGHEGIMLRAPHGPYKQGRSTLNEMYLLKLVRFITAEAVITGSYEQLENCNPNEGDNYGLTKRGHSQHLMFPKGTLGGFNCKGIVEGKLQEFNIGNGVGWTKEFRQAAWNNRASLIGKTITYKYKQIGTDERPRGPVAKGISL